MRRAARSWTRSQTFPRRRAWLRAKSAIWVTSSEANSVYRIDALSRELRQTITVGDGPTGIAVAGGDVWVANTLDGTVSRIDADSNELVGEPIHGWERPDGRRVRRGLCVGDERRRPEGLADRSSRRDGSRRRSPSAAAGSGIAVGGGSVWISDSVGNRVVRLDPKTRGRDADDRRRQRPSAVAFGAGAVWVANTLDGTVSRIDPSSNQVRATVPVGASPSPSPRARTQSGSRTRTARRSCGSTADNGNVAKVIHTGASPTGLALDTIAVGGSASARWSPSRRHLARRCGGRSSSERDPAVAYDLGTWNILNSRTTVSSASRTWAAEKAHRSCRTWRLRCRRRQTAGRRTPFSCARGSATRTGRE